MKIKSSIRLWMAACFLPALAGAGSIRLYEHGSGAEITGTTLTYAWVDTGGSEVGIIERKFDAVNSSSGALSVVVKKVELTPLQEGVSHSFCFAGYCYSGRVFVSPYAETLPAGGSDRELETGLKATYAFDKTVQKPAVEKVAYVFFDKANPSDSAVVYVDYNTLSLSTGIAPKSLDRTLKRPPGYRSGGAVLFMVERPGRGPESMGFRLTDLAGRSVPLTLKSTEKDLQEKLQSTENAKEHP